MAHENLAEITDANFKKEVLSSSIPVIVDFWAAWCQPCLAMGPIVEQIAKEYSGKVKVGKMNVDMNRQTAMNYGIRSIPTMLFFKDGKIVDQVIGLVAKNNLTEKVDKLI